MQTEMKNKNYIVCLLDLYNNRRQCGIYFLHTPKDFLEIGIKMGVSPALKKLLSDRWELHVSKVEDKATRNVMPSCTVVNIIVQLMKRIKQHNEEECRSTTILLPPHVPGLGV